MRSPKPSRRRADRRPALGRAGEAAAAELYGRDGFTVVARNLRTTLGELDLVVRRRDLLVAVEVKTRRGVGAPERAVDDAELARRRDALIAVARVLAPELPCPRLRVDVVAVRWFDESPPELRAFPGAEFRLGRGPPTPWHRPCGRALGATGMAARRRTAAVGHRCSRTPSARSGKQPAPPINKTPLSPTRRWPP